MATKSNKIDIKIICDDCPSLFSKESVRENAELRALLERRRIDVDGKLVFCGFGLLQGFHRHPVYITDPSRPAAHRLCPGRFNEAARAEIISDAMVAGPYGGPVASLRTV